MILKIETSKEWAFLKTIVKFFIEKIELAGKAEGEIYRFLKNFKIPFGILPVELEIAESDAVTLLACVDHAEIAFKGADNSGDFLEAAESINAKLTKYFEAIDPNMALDKRLKDLDNMDKGSDWDNNVNGDWK